MGGYEGGRGSVSVQSYKLSPLSSAVRSRGGRAPGPPFPSLAVGKRLLPPQPPKARGAATALAVARATANCVCRVTGATGAHGPRDKHDAGAKWLQGQGASVRIKYSRQRGSHLAP